MKAFVPVPTTLVLGRSLPPGCNGDWPVIYRSVNPGEGAVRAVTQLAKTFLNAFVNSAGGVLYIGLDRENRVAGLELSREKRDKLRLCVDSVFSAFAPQLDVSLYRLSLIPVVDRSSGAPIDSLYVVQLQGLAGDYPLYFTDMERTQAYTMAGDIPTLLSQMDIIQRFQFGRPSSQKLVGSPGEGALTNLNTLQADRRVFALVGRREILSKAMNFLNDTKNTAVTRVLLLYGLPRTGKTAIANEIVYQLSHDNPNAYVITQNLKGVTTSNVKTETAMTRIIRSFFNFSYTNNTPKASSSLSPLSSSPRLEHNFNNNNNNKNSPGSDNSHDFTEGNWGTQAQSSFSDPPYDPSISARDYGALNTADHLSIRISGSQCMRTSDAATGKVIDELCKCFTKAEDIPPQETSNYYRNLFAPRETILKLENAGDDALVSALIPFCCRCKVVITSRSRIRLSHKILGPSIAFTEIQVPPMTLDEATDLVSMLSPQLDREEAERLANFSGCLPEVISVLSSSLNQKRIDLPTFIDSLKQRSQGNVLNKALDGLPAAQTEALSLLSLLPGAFEPLDAINILTDLYESASRGPISAVKSASSLSGFRSGGSRSISVSIRDACSSPQERIINESSSSKAVNVVTVLMSHSLLSPASYPGRWTISDSIRGHFLEELTIDNREHYTSLIISYYAGLVSVLASIHEDVASKLDHPNLKDISLSDAIGRVVIPSSARLVVLKGGMNLSPREATDAILERVDLEIRLIEWCMNEAQGFLLENEMSQYYSRVMDATYDLTKALRVFDRRLPVMLRREREYLWYSVKRIVEGADEACEPARDISEEPVSPGLLTTGPETEEERTSPGDSVQ